MTNHQIEAALATAAYHADTLRPKEKGWNRGEWVEKYQRAAGIPPGSPWCAAFVMYHLVKAGMTEFPAYRGRVVSWVRYFRDRIEHDPKRGDLFAWLNPDGTGHIGFVTRAYKIGPIRWINTIEGNTDSDGTREGDGVYRRSRIVTARMKFIRMTD